MENSLPKVRRVVTGVDGAGRSSVMSDGNLNRFTSQQVGLVWATDAEKTSIPVHGDVVEDIKLLFGPEGSTRLMVSFIPPDAALAQEDGARSSDVDEFGSPNFREGEGWHQTDSVDYILVLSGSVVCDLEAGSVALNQGDILVQTGTRHRWRNPSNENALLAAVTIGALRK